MKSLLGVRETRAKAESSDSNSDDDNDDDLNFEQDAKAFNDEEIMKKNLSQTAKAPLSNYIKWTSKFEPKKLDDMLGDVKPFRQLSAWLTNFYGKKKSVQTTLVIKGEHGVGKTVGARLAIIDAGFQVKTIKLSDISSKITEKNLQAQLASMLNSGNVMDMLTGSKMKRPVLLFDNIDGITAKNERELVKFIHKTNMKYHLYPIIVISTNKHSKLLSKIESECKSILIPIPAYQTLVQLTESILDRSNLMLQTKAIGLIVNNAQNDARRLINMLEELHRLYHSNSNIQEIDVAMAKRFIETFRKKDLNIGLFEATESLFFKYSGIENACRLFNGDKVILPLMVHENFYEAMAVRKARFGLTNDDCLSAMAEIAESISYGDNIENNIYGDQIWDMMNVYGFYSCIKPSFVLNSRWPSPVDKIGMVYPRDLNKTYLRKINHAHIEKVEPFFTDRTIQNYLLASNIANKLIGDENIKGLRKLFSGYGMTSRTIEALMKIDKIKISANAPRAKRDRQRKILKKAFKE